MAAVKGSRGCRLRAFSLEHITIQIFKFGGHRRIRCYILGIRSCNVSQPFILRAIIQIMNLILIALFRGFIQVRYLNRLVRHGSRKPSIAVKTALDSAYQMPVRIICSTSRRDAA